MSGFLIFGERGEFEGYSLKLDDSFDSSLAVGDLGKLIVDEKFQIFKERIDRLPPSQCQEDTDLVSIAFLLKKNIFIDFLLSDQAPIIESVNLMYSSTCETERDAIFYK